MAASRTALLFLIARSPSPALTDERRTRSRGPDDLASLRFEPPLELVKEILGDSPDLSSNPCLALAGPGPLAGFLDDDVENASQRYPLQPCNLGTDIRGVLG